MEELLTPISQTYRSSNQAGGGLLGLSSTARPRAEPQIGFGSSTPEEALEVLKGQPGYDDLLRILKWLQDGTRGTHSFDIRKPNPQSAQIVHVLVTEIVANYWALLKESSSAQKKSQPVDLLLASLQSISGLNAALAYIRALLQEARKDPKGIKRSFATPNLASALDLLSCILQHNTDIQSIWQAVSSSQDNAGQVRALGMEFVSLIAGGKVVSLAAEAEHVLHQADMLEEPSWIANSKQYADWLGNNLVDWIRPNPSAGDLKICADLTGRGLKLGHSDLMIKILFTGLVLHAEVHPTFEKLLDLLSSADQRKVLLMVLKFISTKYLSSVDADEAIEDYPTIWAAASALQAVIGTSSVRKAQLVAWLSGATGAGLGETCGIRRAALAVLADDKEAMFSVLESSLGLLGDQLYIKHAPMLQQEAHAQVLLLSAGYVHRKSPIKLNVLLRSSNFLNTISNRIGASQDRAKFLGMVVGEALSGLIHNEDRRLNFHMEITDSGEGKWYKSLVSVVDKTGPISPLKSQEIPKGEPAVPKPVKKTPRPAPKPARTMPQSGFIIEEIEDEDESSEEEDDDLVAYAKPTSDEEDEDDDPTLINRNKPNAPVYIRDLIAYLRDTENYDRQKLALATAPALIRRKASHGTEVSAHAEELASLLVGLEDKYELDDFHGFRTQGMIAIIVAQPQKMARWFAKTFFDGDYSLSQRASVLIVLGIGGREIAGFETSEYSDVASFPSKKLPAKVEKHYEPSAPANRYISASASLRALPPNALDNISQSLSQAFLAPLAAEAADAATGPDVLKLSSFTSRLQQQTSSSAAPVTTSRTKAHGVHSIPNTTANLLATSFFFPLTSRFQAALHSPSATRRGLLFDPSLLTLYLKTLALLLHAAGPSTLALPQMTAEFWDLLLGVRTHCVGEVGVAGAVLFGLMALLDVNENDTRGLCQRHGHEVVESVEWVSGVFDRTRGGDQGGNGEENQVKMMAAGVLIRLREMVERYRALLMGDMIGFS
ncbi:telomere length regulation protein [Apiospora kogelbergensis]|uniref:Telomere length regulation protein n=1 Tax=Apiospora kogelbergensis TaxID=1337665 RepID=A0AAW0QW03_9PEZI